MIFNEQKIESDIQTFLKTYAYAYCQKARELLVNETRCVIRDFYSAPIFNNPNDRTKPVYYDRTFDFRDNSYKGFVKPRGKILYGGVRISTDKMQDYKSDDKMTVLQLAIHGWHGDPSRNLHSDSPLEKLLLYSQSDKFKKEIINHAENEVRKKKYNYIKI